MLFWLVECSLSVVLLTLKQANEDEDVVTITVVIMADTTKAITVGNITGDTTVDIMADATTATTADVMAGGTTTTTADATVETDMGTDMDTDVDSPTTGMDSLSESTNKHFSAILKFGELKMNQIQL